MLRNLQRLDILSVCLLTLWAGLFDCGCSPQSSVAGKASAGHASNTASITITLSPGTERDNFFGDRRVKSSTLVSLNWPTYLGYTFTYSSGQRRIVLTNGPSSITMQIGSRKAIINGKEQTLAVPPELVRIIPKYRYKYSKPALYPFIPLQPFARMAGWSVTQTPLSAEERRYNPGYTVRTTLSKPFHPATMKLTWQQVIDQKLVHSAAWADSRVRVTPSFTIDASRTQEYTNGRYVAVVNCSVKAIGRAPIHTGDFAIFLESDDSWITNVGSQSDWQQLYLAPGKEPQGVNSPQLFPLSIHTRITRIIYNDGLSCASWPVR